MAEAGKVVLDLRDFLFEQFAYVPKAEEDFSKEKFDPYLVALALLDDAYFEFEEEDLISLARTKNYNWRLFTDSDSEHLFVSDLAQLYLLRVWPYFKEGWELGSRRVVDGFLVVGLHRGRRDGLSPTHTGLGHHDITTTKSSEGLEELPCGYKSETDRGHPLRGSQADQLVYSN